jgi:hypothetical protein
VPLHVYGLAVPTASCRLLLLLLVHEVVLLRLLPENFAAGLDVLWVLVLLYCC